VGSFTIRIVEVRRYRDDGFADRLPDVLLGGLPQFLENHCGNFRRRVFLVDGRDTHVAVLCPDDPVGHHLHFFVHFIELPAHEPLDREDRVFRIGHGLALGDLSHQPFAALRERHDRWRQPAAFWIRDNRRFAAFHDGDN
jgi:hypothetical protein